MFSVCPHLGGTPSPSPSHNASTGPMSFPRGTPSPSHNTSTGPMSFLGGTPVTGLSNWFPPIMGWGNSLPRSGTRGGYPGQVRVGVPRGTPLSWDGLSSHPSPEYLIRCGRYASCVHAGGLSCFEEYCLELPIRPSHKVRETKC